MADLVSKKSKDPSTQVGAVLVDDKNRMVSIGYNGFARGTADHRRLYLDRPEKHRRILHAEANALLFADRAGVYLYVTHPPCSQCTAMALQSGVHTIIYDASRHLAADWEESFESAVCMAWEANAGIFKYDVYNGRLSRIHKATCEMTEGENVKFSIDHA